MVKILFPENSGIFKIASEAFISLFTEISGVTPEITSVPDDTNDLVIFGSDAVNEFAHSMIEKGVCLGFRIRYGSDDYHILSVEENGRTLLFLAGGRPRSILYAVYRFFELRCGCRYFWDGDIIPKVEKISLSGMDVAESPRFHYRGTRYFAHRGLKRFQAEHWDFDDWKKEIDYLLKKRLNLMMLRIGLDDLFQKAFPEDVPYPDPDKSQPSDIPRSYNDRTLFWSLEYRGELRRKVLAYARERDMMHPEDCGTMTHWYSRTPRSFLDSVRPEFLPQWTQDYSEPESLVWDFRIKKNMDNYFKLTEAHIENYGTPELFHTIGLAERGCFRDRSKNQQLKHYAYHLIDRQVHEKYPAAQLLITSWDFTVWSCEEVRELISTLNPENTILWDYISDTFDEVNNFTNWNVIGKFPYVFGIFHAFAASTEIRGNYPAIERRLSQAANDPMCRGMIFWPENAHADTLMLEYFAANSWEPVHDIESFITDFCRSRYQGMAGVMENIWRTALPIIKCGYWRWNQHRECEVYPDYPFTLAHGPQHLCNLNLQTLERNNLIRSEFKPHLSCAIKTLELLGRLDLGKSDSFIIRDVRDLARTAAGRILNYAFADLTLLMENWRNGECESEVVLKRLEVIGMMMQFQSLILESHEDYSLWASLNKLGEHTRVKPYFENTLKGNSENSYCRSYVYELFRACYLPEFDAYGKWIAEKISADDRSPWRLNDSLKQAFRKIEDDFYSTPLSQFAPDIEKAAVHLPENLMKMSEDARALMSDGHKSINSDHQLRLYRLEKMRLRNPVL